MTAEEQIKRIEELMNELDLADMTRAEFEEEILKQSINDIKDEMWRMYCFVSDVCYTLNE